MNTQIKLNYGIKYYTKWIINLFHKCNQIHPAQWLEKRFLFHLHHHYIIHKLPSLPITAPSPRPAVSKTTTVVRKCAPFYGRTTVIVRNSSAGWWSMVMVFDLSCHSLNPRDEKHYPLCCGLQYCCKTVRYFCLRRQQQQQQPQRQRRWWWWWCTWLTGNNYAKLIVLSKRFAR